MKGRDILVCVLVIVGLASVGALTGYTLGRQGRRHVLEPCAHRTVAYVVNDGGATVRRGTIYEPSRSHCGLSSYSHWIPPAVAPSLRSHRAQF